MSSSLRQKFYTFFLIILIILVFLPLLRNWRQKQIIEDEIQNFREEIAAKEISNKKLREAITYLESDSSLEETARLNLGMKKPGESVAVIKEEIATSSQLTQELKVESNYLKWFKYFFN